MLKNPRLLPDTLTCTKLRRIKIEASMVDKQKKEEDAVCPNLLHLYSNQLDVVMCKKNFRSIKYWQTVG